MPACVVAAARIRKANELGEPEAAGIQAAARRPLVPRPRLHLIRFHGVLAPNAKLCSEMIGAQIRRCERDPRGVLGNLQERMNKADTRKNEDRVRSEAEFI
jgi:hypothetical protein